MQDSINVDIVDNDGCGGGSDAGNKDDNDKNLLHLTIFQSSYIVQSNTYKSDYTSSMEATKFGNWGVSSFSSVLYFLDV